MKKILIYGAGIAGQSILKELQQTNEQVIGFIDDDDTLISQKICDVAVLGSSNEIELILAKHAVNHFIIAIPSAHTDKINSALYRVLSYNCDIHVQMLPYITRSFDSPLIDDLEDSSYIKFIDRDEINYNINTLTQSYSGKSVLVTGAGGSIGSELCRMLLRFNVKTLICLGRGEGSIYTLSRTLNKFNTQNSIKYVIADVKDKKMMNIILNNYQPEIVFHAAAHKHVPLMEDNIREAYINNVSGTINVLEASVEANVSKFLFVSTDKAVYPSSIMGYTKRIGELITKLYSHKISTAVVRFGNVLGSRGSVIPLFNEQIEKGGPVTITHPDMRRYFMTIPEAAMLVINSALLVNDNSSHALYILNMGREYFIREIAENIIRSKGLTPGKEIKLVYTGLRSGEKLREKLIYDYEQLENTENPNILNVNSDSEISNTFQTEIVTLLENIYDKNESEIYSAIVSLLQQYTNI